MLFASLFGMEIFREIWHSDLYTELNHLTCFETLTL